MPLNKTYLLLILFLLFCSANNYAQVNISGIVIDENNEVLPGGTIKVLGKDSVFITGAVTDINGAFSIDLPKNSKYTLMVSSPIYFGRGKMIPLFTGTSNQNLGKIRLDKVSLQLKEVEVKTLAQRGEQKGDTTLFNADAFKVNKDATAEDLVKKMPGITSDNNGLKVNGETVQKVLVDGKPFFGDDPNATMKNLPADLIEKVQVFDKMSDQAAFTGFSDGDQQKTINLITRKEKNVGQFGRIYGGAGADEDKNFRYNNGASVNSFNNKQRISLLLLSNNVNQQNFSSADISGAMGNSGQSGGGGGRQGGGGPGGNMSGSSSLLTTPQSGNNITNSAGLNYSDVWGKKINVSGSYFYNYTDNKNTSTLARNYFTGNQLVYNQSNSGGNLNQNHRFNLRFDYQLDSANKLTLTPVFSFQNNAGKSLINGTNRIGETTYLSKTITDSKNNNLAYDFSNNLLWLHKLRKQGRSLSVNLNTGLSERNNNGSYYSQNSYSDTSSSGLDQHFITYSYTKKAALSVSYTEPLSKTSQLQFNYNPSYTEGLSNKSTNDFNNFNSNYDLFNTNLSNKYNNIYLTQKAGLTYRYNKAKLNFNLGADAQQAQLNGDQTYPLAFSINQTFKNILPNAMLNYKFKQSQNLRLYYRSSTNIPSVSQLQNVLDISNPLQVKTGNTALKQSFDNNLTIRFGGFDPKTSRNAMLFFNEATSNNYISNATYILRNDTTLQGYTLKSGSQLSKPVNLNGYYTARLFFVYGFPVKAIKSNLNFNGGLSYAHTPGIINNTLNISTNYAPGAGIYIGSNISQNLDFSLAYNGNYTIVENNSVKQSNNNYFTHSATFKLTWLFLKGVVLSTDVSNTLYSGLSQNYSQSYFLWNAYLGYKFLKNKNLEAKVTLFDILNQNRNISRTITASYTEDSYTTVLRRYGLFTLTYTLKHFKSGTAPKAEDNHPPMFPGGPPPGMRPPGGNN